MYNSLINTLFFSSSFFLAVIYIFNMLCAFLSSNSSLFQYPGFSVLGALSVILFSIVLIICSLKKDLFFLFLPFVLLAFPNVINDFFPSFMMGPIIESRVASFSFITHIDLFLLYGLFFLKKSSKQIINQKEILKFLFLLTLILFFFLLTIFFTSSEDLLFLFATGNYQIRYILIFILYMLRIDLEKKHFQYVIYGFSFSLWFLLVESSFFSLKTGRDHLISGSLAANVFANITAAITLFFVFIKSKTFNLDNYFFQIIRFITIMVGFLIMIFNGTRMAMLSFFLSGLSFYVLTSFKVKDIFQFISRLIGYSILFFIFVLIALQFDKFRSIISIFNDLINLKFELNEDTASLFARLHMYKVSLNMILEEWFIGVGPGRWNFLKYEYGFQQMGTLLTNTLLDPHSDYLSYISQYGIFGLFMIGFILFKPSIQFFKNPQNYYSYFGIIPFTLLISGLTNSNTLKHQIFATVAMLLFLVIQKHKKPITNENSIYWN